MCILFIFPPFPPFPADISASSYLRRPSRGLNLVPRLPWWAVCCWLSSRTAAAGNKNT